VTGKPDYRGSQRGRGGSVQTHNNWTRGRGSQGKGCDRLVACLLWSVTPGIVQGGKKRAGKLSGLAKMAGGVLSRTCVTHSLSCVCVSYVMWPWTDVILARTVCLLTLCQMWGAPIKAMARLTFRSKIITGISQNSLEMFQPLSNRKKSIKLFVFYINYTICSKPSLN